MGTPSSTVTRKTWARRTPTASSARNPNASRSPASEPAGNMPGQRASLSLTRTISDNAPFIADVRPGREGPFGLIPPVTARRAFGVAAGLGTGPAWHVAMRSEETLMSTYKVIEVIGTSATSWEDAAAQAIKTASETLHDLRVAEVTKQDIHVDEGGGITFRTKLELSFKYERQY